jgi:hypothetical protein
MLIPLRSSAPALRSMGTSDCCLGEASNPRRPRYCRWSLVCLRKTCSLMDMNFEAELNPAETLSIPNHTAQHHNGTLIRRIPSSLGDWRAEMQTGRIMCGRATHQSLHYRGVILGLQGYPGLMHVSSPTSKVSTAKVVWGHLDNQQPGRGPP